MLIPRRIPIVVALIAGGVALLGLALDVSAAPTQAFIYPSPSCPTTIQACLNAANPGDEVRLQPGLYITSVTINKDVSLVRDDSGGPGPAILQAPPGQRVVLITGAVSPTAHVAHLTIQGGGLAAGNGAGILVQSPAQPSLHDLLIQNNTVTGTDAVGGGLFTHSSLTLTNVQFLTNTAFAGSGGGLGGAPGVALTLVNVNFHNNAADDGGGGLFADSAVLNNSTFVNNVAGQLQGGGAYLTSTVTATGTAFTNNESLDSGGALFVGGALTFTGGLFAGNESTGGSGGGLRVVGRAVISGTQFISNTALNPGGGLRASVALTLTNTTFLSNTTQGTGGGVRANASAVVTGGSFVANTAGNGGGGLYAASATVAAATFDQNEVLVGNGGGLYAAALLTVTDSLFTANRVLSGTQVNGNGAGGGLYSDGVLASSGNRFVGNFAFRLGGGMDTDDTISIGDEFRGNLTGPQGSGGGLFVSGVFDLAAGQFFTNTAGTGGGLGVNSTAVGSVTNSLFAGNLVTSTDGGAAMRLLSTQSVVVTHTTMVGANQSGRAAVHIQSTGLFTFTNNIFTNQAIGIKNFGTLTATEDYNLFFTVPLTKVGPVALGLHSLAGDPRFVNPDAGNYHLRGDSPAIDAGLFQGLTLDFEGDARGQPAGYDLGFDEYFARLFLPLVLR